MPVKSQFWPLVVRRSHNNTAVISWHPKAEVFRQNGKYRQEVKPFEFSLLFAFVFKIIFKMYKGKWKENATVVTKVPLVLPHSGAVQLISVGLQNASVISLQILSFT